MSRGARADDVDGVSPSAREVAGAFRAMGSSARVPPARVGVLARALGAHVDASDEDMMEKLSRVVDPHRTGTFALNKVRASARCDGANWVGVCPVSRLTFAFAVFVTRRARTGERGVGIVTRRRTVTEPCE